ncbi:MAG: cell division protein ZipA C-terminal FtsZ-binding domain-containing protein [Pseudomonadota bacterium]
MDSLRIALLVIGIVIIIAVYLTVRRKPAAEVRNSPAVERVEPNFGDEVGEPESSIIKVTPAFSEAVDSINGADEEAFSKDVFGAEGPEPEPQPKRSNADAPEKVISLRIVGKAQKEFSAEEVILTLRDAGLSHGRFGIFHKLDDSDGEDALFSVASLTEPGTFDLQNLADKTLAGLSFFMLRPGPGRGVDAFDKMIEAARAVAISLQGELLDGDGSTLSIQRERFLREDLIQYELKHLKLQ